MQSEKKDMSFTWLNITQFFGALNDNVFKLMIIFFLVEIMDFREEEVVSKVSIVFILPFLLFAQAGGVLADQFSKRDVLLATRIGEVLVMLLGFVAITWRIPALLYAVMFLMTTLSAFFSPSKYGIVPELVPADGLSRANGALVGLTYLAIILGTFIPSWLLCRVFNNNFSLLAGICVAIAIAGTAAASAIRRTPPAGGSRRMEPLFFVDIFRTIAGMRNDRHLFLAVLGSAYFLFLAAFIQQNLLIYGSQHLGLNFKESGFLFPMAALGIGAGGWIAGRLSGRNIEFGIVPIGALGLMVGCVALSIVAPGFMAVLPWIFIAGLSCGLFTVPLEAFIQNRAPESRRGEILAAASFLGFFGVALSSGLLSVLTLVLNLGPELCFLVAGLLTTVLALAAFKVLPDFFLRFVVLVVTRCIYKIKVSGRENIPIDGGAVLVANHVTWVDALLIAATQQRRIRFMMYRDIYEIRLLNPIFRLMGVIPVSAMDSPRMIMKSIMEARAAMEAGYLVCIFAEGSITRNGNLQAFRPGFERIVQGTECPVIPVYIGGAWGSVLSYYHGKMPGLNVTIPYAIRIHIGAPMPAASTTDEVRRAIMELSVDFFQARRKRGRNLGRLFVQAARRNWFRAAVADTTGKRLSFGRALAGALFIGSSIRQRVRNDRMIGILLPSSVGGALANYAVTLLGKVSVNLNFTASKESLSYAVGQCEIKTVLTSRAFLQKIDASAVPDGLVYLEDIMAGAGPVSRLMSLGKALLWPICFLSEDREPGPDDPATVIFSSGSTGEPKGVVLTHHNIISNIEAFLMLARFRRSDKMCGVLPFFHSFGFTCTLWCPAIRGIFTSYHTSPIDGGVIAEMVRKEKLTALLATPTFLLAYLRKASKEDLATLRLVIVGAEKLKAKVADAFEERFGIRPMEGYGATELSPVAALSIHDVDLGGIHQSGHKDGSVGHPVPGVAVKVVDASTGLALPPGERGVLMVKGPNVMTGYLGQPAKTAEVLRNGWYDTGDVVQMDADGFIFIIDRVSRYSKIGGEMVPHLAIEDAVLSVVGGVGQSVFVSSAPDDKKGEALVLFFVPEAGGAAAVEAAIKNSNLPNLWKPRHDNLVAIDKMPALGSGKLDQKRLKQMAAEHVSARQGREPESGK
jgi:acyl-[acyl-carrier-protein]-phospholipid O-acyltransferase / long-chain-fatty-acid--[acyl-carrier-protein] ligase